MKQWRENDGRFIHDGDCHFWGSDICTCGLIHHLMPNPPDGDWFFEEWARHDIQMNRVPDRQPYVKPTKEELAKQQKMLNEVFPNNEIDLAEKKLFKPKTSAEYALRRAMAIRDAIRETKL